MDIGRSLPVSLFLHSLLCAVALIIGGNSTLTKKDLTVTLMEEQGMQRDLTGQLSRELQQDIKRAPAEAVTPAPASKLRHPENREPLAGAQPIVSGMEATAAPYAPPGGPQETSGHVPGSGGGAVFITSHSEGFSAPSQGLADSAGQETHDNGAAMKSIRSAIESNLIYPYIAIRKHMEGTVKAEFAINRKGYPEEIRITGSSGFAVLDEAARNTLMKASPFPAVPGRIEIPITFMLKNKEGNR